MMVGQVIGGIGQPLIFNMVTRGEAIFRRERLEVSRADPEPSIGISLSAVTMDWFPNDERDIATTIAYQSAGVGVIFFSILPPAMVQEPSQLAGLLLLQLVGYTAVGILCFFFFAEGPTRPPSAAAAMQWATREEARIQSEKSNVDRNKATFEAMMRDFGSLFQNTNYMLLVTSFAFVQGMAYALPTLVGQVRGPCRPSARWHSAIPLFPPL